MWRCLRTAVCCAILCVGLTAPSKASESRLVSFAFPCTGTQQSVTFNAQALNNRAPGTQVNRFVQGVDIILFEKDGPVQFIVLMINGDPSETLALMSNNDLRVFHDFTGFYSFTTDTAGNIPFAIAGRCTGGGQIQGLVMIAFFS